MKEVAVTMWAVDPEEAITLPKETQLIEYCPFSKRLAIKRSDHCLYDRHCVYLLTKDPKTLLGIRAARTSDEKIERRK